MPEHCSSGRPCSRAGLTGRLSPHRPAASHGCTLQDVMKLVIPGGSGQVGTLVARHATSRGDEVVVLSRAPAEPTPDAPWRTAAWNPEGEGAAHGRTLGPWADELDGADAVLNLAGRSVDCRYTPANRRAILDSRVASTRVVGKAIVRAKNPPPVWLQMSTATVYAHRFDTPNDEATGLIGGDEPGVPDTWRFSIDVARAWEAAARAACPAGTRLVLLRTAMVMSPDTGGVFDVLLRLVRLGLGGTSGSGRQFVSWIHDADLVRALDWLVAHGDIDGPVNLVAPDPLPNAAFMRALRRAWGTRVGLPANRLMLEAGAFALRTETELVLKSRRVVPGRLLAGGFAFEQPVRPAAAADLAARWRATARRRGTRS